MALASARNGAGHQQVSRRPRNEALDEYRHDRVPETMNLDSKELYYQVHMGKYNRPFLITNAEIIRHTLHTCRECWLESTSGSYD